MKRRKVTLLLGATITVAVALSFGGSGMADTTFSDNVEVLARQEGTSGHCYLQSATGSQGYATFCYTGQYPYKCMGPNYGCFSNSKRECIY